MNRRQFLTRSLLTTAAMSSGAIPGLSQIAHASAFAPVTARTLVNIKLDGGPDFRHLLAPAFNSNTSSFGYQSWSAMASAHALAPSASAWEQRWNQDYTPYVAGNQQFGILNNCGWLKSMWEQGKVAVVANVYGSPSRDHALASLVMDQGDRSSGPADSQRSGWGGRLAQNLGTNVMAVTRTPRAFCYAPDPADPQKRVTDGMIAAQDVRELKLFSHDPTDMPHQAQPVISRALSSYYAAKRAEIPSNSIYKRFFDMEQQLRELGAPIEERLQSLPVPPAIDALAGDTNPLLDSPYFATQIRNLYDTIALNDIFDARIASLEYLGFDTHEDQKTEIEVRFQDLFGTGMGLHALWISLPADARANTVFMLSGEFGRQIRANGDAGSDHGEGTCTLIIGEQVNGGVYGELFPEAELARLNDNSPQIEGKTAIDHVFGRVCDWMQPGTGDVVFPGRASAPMEAGVDLGGLLTT